MNLRQKYTEETGKDANRLPYQSICSVTIDYVEWLERQLCQYNVVRQSEQLVCQESKLDCPYDFTSRCTLGRCDCKPKAN